MFGLRQTFVFAIICVSTFVSAAPHPQDDAIVDWNRLSAILDTIDNSVLHSVLHNLSPKFRDGVFSKDRAAIEHVHSSNPVLASKLVYVAKRQDNTTTTQSPPSSTVVVPVDPTISSVVSSQITASELPAPTTVIVAPTTAVNEVAVTTVTGAVVFSSVGGGVVTRTSSAIGVSFTRSTSTHYFYSTAPDGTVMTSTSLVIVNAPITETAIPTGAAQASGSDDPGLQNIGARQQQSKFGFLLHAAFVGFFGLFIAL